MSKQVVVITSGIDEKYVRVQGRVGGHGVSGSVY